MNTNLVGIVAFSLGAAVGSLITWKLIDAKYKQIADDEIRDVKEHFLDMKRKMRGEIEEDCEEKPEENAVISEYSDISSSYQTTDERSEEPMKDMKPFVIPPEEFGNLDGYEAESLIYYEGDEVLTDDWNNVIENIDAMVGEDFADHFGEYEDDSVFIRNNMFKKDFEILKDERSFESIKNRPKNRPPHWVDDDE